MRFVIALLLTIPLFAYGQQDIPSLSENAPKDKPFRWQAEELSQKEAALAPFIQAARKNYPQAKGRFISGLPSDEHFFVVTRIHDGSKYEQTFIYVDKIENGIVTGKIANNMVVLTQYHRGQTITFPENSVIDWVITKPDGSEEGNLVGKYLDTLQ